MTSEQHLFALLTTSIATFLLAVFIFLKNRKVRINQIFTLYSLSISIWSLGQALHSIAPNLKVCLFWARFSHVGVVFIPTLFLHFVFELLAIEKAKKKILAIAYGFSIFFTYFNLFTTLYISTAVPKFSFKYYIEPGFFYSFSIVFFIICIVYGFYQLFKEYKVSSGARHNQLKYLLWPSLLGYIGGGANFLFVYDIIIYPLNPFGTYFVALYILAVAYAIVRYRVMDIRLVFTRTMAYSLSAGLLTGFFIVFVLTITKLISTFTEIDSFKISIFAALIIALLFNPLRNRVQTLVDKVFYKKSYDYYATIRKVSHDLASMFDFKKIYSFIGDIIFSTLGLKNIYLLSAVPRGDYKVVYSRSFEGDENREDKGNEKGEEGWREDVVGTQTQEEVLKIDRNSEMVKLLRTSDDIVIKDELPGIKEILGQEIINNITSSLKPFNGEAVMPVFVDDKLEFLMILGEKLSGDIFTNEDISLIDTISHETAIAIKNARLYKEKVLSERLASMGMMSATFAHEIRNPLTSIKTFAQLIPEKYTDTEFRNTFSKIVIDEIERIDVLIEDLMSFSSKEAIPRANDLDITALIDETLEHLKGKLELEKKNIAVEKFYKNVKINVFGDSKKLKQAFINIITNSCQAMDENGVLKVNIIPNGQDVDVTITDMGKGIPPWDINTIFDPFYTTKHRGVGLGLAISKKIIEDHGGRIAVKSMMLKGTTFTISLPMQNK